MAAGRIGMFLGEIGKLHSDYRGIDAKIIAFDWQGTWVDFASRFVLLPNLRKRPYKHQRFQSRIGELCLISDASPAEKLADITAIIASSQLSQ